MQVVSNRTPVEFPAGSHYIYIYVDDGDLLGVFNLTTNASGYTLFDIEIDDLMVYSSAL